MERFYKTEDLVKSVLIEYPDSRNSDDVLVFRVYKELNEEAVIRELFCEIMLNRKEYGLPSYKTIERCRRKLVSKYPELAPIKSVEKARKEEEVNYKTYALNN